MNNKSHVWRNKWIEPYESVWSIIEKFKYCNAITGKQLQNIFEVKGFYTSSKYNREHFVYRNATYDLMAVNAYFKLDREHFNPINSLLNNDPEIYLNETLYYCPKCIERGYHSYFHQLKFLDKCLFHNDKLIIAKGDKDYEVKYTIHNKSHEAYKTGCDTPKKRLYKYVNVLPASQLITTYWEDISKKLESSNEFPYENIKLVSPVYNGKQKQLNTSAIMLLQELFIEKSTNRTPIYIYKKEKCKENYIKLENYVMTYINDRGMLYGNSDLSLWYISNIVRKYVSLTTIDLITEAQQILNHIILYNSDTNTNETKLGQFKIAVAIVMLALFITGERTTYTAINKSLAFASPKFYRWNCCISFNNMLIEKIDDYKYSEYLLYKIIDKVSLIMYQLIKSRITPDICDDLMIHLSKINFEHIPQYLVITTEEKYLIFECL